MTTVAQYRCPICRTVHERVPRTSELDERRRLRCPDADSVGGCGRTSKHELQGTRELATVPERERARVGGGR